MKFIRHLTTIDSHVGGEPLRIITGGPFLCRGGTMVEASQYFQRHYDGMRQTLMNEPRGHAGMHGCVITPPVTPDAHFGLLFMHHDGFGGVNGHGIIAAVTVAIETGFIAELSERTKVVIDVPGRTIFAYAECSDQGVKSVSFSADPSFALRTDVPVKLLDRNFSIDIAYDGAIYAIVNSYNVGLSVELHQLTRLQEWSNIIIDYIKGSDVLNNHEQEIEEIGGVIFIDRPHKGNSRLRSVTVQANGHIDRCTLGRGMSAKMAVLHHKGQLQFGEEFIDESIIGSQASGRIVETTWVEAYKAVITRMKGRAFITGTHQFIVDPSDPLKNGFLLR